MTTQELSEPEAWPYAPTVLPAGLVEDARRAFASDPEYLVDILEHASLIAYKQSIWSARKDISTASSKAQSQCREDTDRCCLVEGPCGTGACPYAQPEIDGIVIGITVGTSSRPIPARHPTYDLTTAAHLLAKARGVSKPATLSGTSRRRPEHRTTESEHIGDTGRASTG